MYELRRRPSVDRMATLHAGEDANYLRAPSIALRCGVTRVTALVLAPDVRDRRVLMLHLDLERSDQRIFSVHDNVARLVVQLETNGKTQVHPSGLWRLR